MFSLVYGLWKYLFTKQQFNILILGLDDSGKTTFLERCKSIFKGTSPIPPDRITPTVGLNVGKFEGYGKKLVLWDVGGQRGLRSIWDKYYPETHGLVFVVDSAKFDRQEECRDTFEEGFFHPLLKGVPVLIFANKTDIASHSSPLDVGSFLGVDLTNHRVHIQQGSALKGEGVAEGLEWLIDELKDHCRELPSSQSQPGLQ
eukprot:GCRY01001469.1.p1 GENE.GCRY01001469.1~~GCRY01001469.1.p1  ORF type:complete len:201 (+),score=19.12 GCRY01001469.1:186-788(+)